MQHCIGARPLAAAPRALSARIGLSIPKPAQAVHVCTSAQPKLGLRQAVPVAAKRSVAVASAAVSAPTAEPTESAKFASEFTATALFCYLSCTAFATASQMAAGNALHSTLMVITSHFAFLPIILYAAAIKYVFAPISGAHFNPLISVALAVANKLPVKSAVSYVVAQLLGAVLGSALALFCLPSGLQSGAVIGALAIPATRTAAQAFLGEVIASFFFISAVLGLIASPKGWGKNGPWAVVVSVPLLQWLFSGISSACFNPARAFGPAVVLGDFTHQAIYYTAPFVGAIAAALLFSKVLGSLE